MKVETMPRAPEISAFFDMTDKEKSAIARSHHFLEALIYLHFGLAFFGYLPFWSFCIAAFIYVPRWMIALHEAEHCFTPKTINPITKLNLLSLTPFQLGYREMRDIHLRHHAHPMCDKDPEYYHERGSWLAGYINAILSPELSVYFWIRDKGIDAELLKGMAIRLVVFSAIATGFGWQSLWYFIPVRLAYGTSLFLFSYGLHRKGKEQGTYRMIYPTLLEKTMRVVYGETLLQSVGAHDIHHDYPAIAGHKLRAARPFYRPRKSHENNPAMPA
jgi:fatty acid desaturase